MARDLRKPSYEKTYEPFVLERIDLQKTVDRNIKVGQVIEFDYEGSKNNPHLVWVLNPNFQFQLHGISLKDVPWHRFKLLLKKIVSDDVDLIESRLKDVSLPVDELIERHDLFYEQTVKNHVINRKHEPYRRFLYSKMNRIKLVMLDLRDMVQYPPQYISPSGRIYEADQKT